MNTRFSKAFYCLLFSIAVIAPGFTSAQSTVNFDVDVTVSNYKIIKILALPGNKVGVLIGTPNYSNVYLWVYNSSGTRITNTDITSLITWPSSDRVYTEFNAIVTDNGNIFITYTSADSDLKLTDYATFLIINDVGAQQATGQVNTTNPGNSLTRFIQLAKLSDGKIVVVFQRTDDYTFAFRIFNANGTAFSPGDVAYAGPGTPNPFGPDAVWESRIGAFRDGNFVISFSYFDASFRAILFDNSGNTLLVGGSGSFALDPAVESEYNSYAIVPLANGNAAVFWGVDGDSYFKIIDNDGSTVQAKQGIAGGRNLGNFVPNNTSGSEGFYVTESTAQDSGDPFGNPYYSYAVNAYNQTGVLQGTTPLQGFLIKPTYYLTNGLSGGYAYVYSYYKSFIVSDGEFTLTSDNDLKGAMVDFSMSTLPVSLIDYTVRLLSTQKAQLDWSTASESNSKYFAIEKSSDGRSFTTIGRVDAAGNSSSTKRYGFIDPEMITRKIWYRLKQFDIDGKEKDLGTKFIQPGSGAGAAVSVYPNPLKGNTLTINTRDSQLPIAYSLTDVQGRTMKTGILLQSQEQIDVQDLPSGIFFLRVGKNPVIKIKK